jgi:hypothetical protein
MASWDAVTGAEEKRVGLRCLACGRRLESPSLSWDLSGVSIAGSRMPL